MINYNKIYSPEEKYYAASKKAELKKEYHAAYAKAQLCNSSIRIWRWYSIH